MAQPDTTHYRHKLLAVRTALLEQIAGQRGGHSGKHFSCIGRLALVLVVAA